MTWVLMRMERSDAIRRKSQNTLELTKLKRQLTRLGSFASAIGDGSVTPSEIGSLGNDLFGDALDFMGYSRDVADQIAQEKCASYETAYSDVTATQYYNNGALAAQAELYFDPTTGTLDTTTMYNEFYEEALKEFAEDYIQPILNEKETEIQNQIDNLEAEIETDEAYLEQLESAVSSATPKIKLA